MEFFKDDTMPGSENLKNFLQSNIWMLWTVRMLLVIYASFVAPNLNRSGAMFFNNVIVRLLLAILIIYLCYVDPTSAILLAVSFVVSVQSLNKYKVSSIMNPTDSFSIDNENESFANPQIMQTEESQEHKMNDEPFTSKEQLDTAQNNETGSDQLAQVQTWKEQLGPQGLNSPGGYNLNSTNGMDNVADF